MKQIPLNIISVLGYLLMVAGILLLAANSGLFSSHAVVILSQIAAGVLMFWARRTFGRRSFHLTADPTEGGLVTSGPYRYIRHPIYASIILFAWAGIGSSPNLRHGWK